MELLLAVNFSLPDLFPEKEVYLPGSAGDSFERALLSDIVLPSQFTSVHVKTVSFSAPCGITAAFSVAAFPALTLI